MIKLTDNALLSCDLSLRDWLGFAAPNLETIRAFVEKDQELVDMLNQFYLEPTTSLDTEDRNALWDSLAREYTNRAWPLNMEDQTTVKAFHKKLIKRLNAAGWRNTQGKPLT